MYKITAYIERDPETELYVAIVPGIPGAHTQAETLDELQENLKEVIELCLEEMDSDTRERLLDFVGIQQVEVAG
ncbi:unnamed protein product [marine sediment metagenome]|uniref:HicB-like antitoxin of toxin-antitoxin system domain-containing protein n=1 Tax=marine sediment metagenome TaxID=412755 RepID=X1FC89_9ZZZZ